MNSDKIDNLLLKIENLLLKFQQQEWAKAFRKARILYNTDELAGRTEILGLFGGLGSITDLILYTNEIPLIEENNELHDMLELIYLELHKS